TIHQDRMIILADGAPIPSFTLTNNIAPQNDYGIFGSGAGFGNSALAAYFPNAVVRRNAIGGANPSLYPPDNFYPDMATFNAQFVDLHDDDYHLVPASIFNGAGTDGRNLGVDFAALDAA